MKPKNDVTEVKKEKVYLTVSDMLKNDNFKKIKKTLLQT